MEKKLDERYLTEIQQSQTYSLHRAMNERFFEGKLREVALTYTVGKYNGYFWSGKFAERGNDRPISEISLNPESFTRDDRATLATLLHEMVHQWVDEQGKGARKSYHDKQWAKKMVEVGLMPSDTGLPGGKTTGQKMTHYVIEGGMFDTMADSLIGEGLTKVWGVPAPKAKKIKGNDRIKYTCPSCSTNIWAKAGIAVICEDCDEHYVETGK